MVSHAILSCARCSFQWVPVPLSRLVVVVHTLFHQNSDCFSLPFAGLPGYKYGQKSPKLIGRGSRKAFTLLGFDNASEHNVWGSPSQFSRFGVSLQGESKTWCCTEPVLRSKLPGPRAVLCRSASTPLGAPIAYFLPQQAVTVPRGIVPVSSACTL